MLRFFISFLIVLYTLTLKFEILLLWSSQNYLDRWSRHASVDGHQWLGDSSSSYATGQITFSRVGSAISAIDAAHAGKFVHHKAIPADSSVACHTGPQAGIILN